MKVKTNLNQATILITGAAGFIGAALTQRILREYQDCYVVGLDNLNDYYDPALKEYRCTETKKPKVKDLVSIILSEEISLIKVLLIISSENTHLILLSTLLLKQAYVIVSIILIYILKAILSAFTTSWKPAAIAMTMVVQE